MPTFSYEVAGAEQPTSKVSFENVWLVEGSRKGHTLLKKQSKITWGHLFHSFVHAFKEANLTAVSDVRGSTVVGANAAGNLFTFAL